MSKECLHCGEDNADSAAVCKNCGSKLDSGTSSNSGKVPTGAAVLKMIDLKSGREIIIKSNCTIGREGDLEAEFFAEDMHISRRHCNVILENGEFKIEHLSKVTPTKINNIELSRGIQKTIRNGNTLTIADKIFDISICQEEVCEDAQEISSTVNDDSVNTIPESKPVYVVVCPKCGSEYEVDNINEKIKECKYCDEYDKNEISKIGAKLKYAN